VGILGLLNSCYEGLGEFLFFSMVPVVLRMPNNRISSNIINYRNF
jgi:hypothetical protein